ncbi:MAG: VanW family protein [Actinomycetota bacterium]|nr:VanW family protein [Actinomycetota bacterium]
MIASALSFRLDPSSEPKFTPELRSETLAGAVARQLASTETPARNASVRFGAGGPTVTPGQDGRRIDYPATVANLIPVLSRTGAERTVSATYASRRAKVTTDQLTRALGAGEVSTFATGGFAPDSGQNIRRAAELINGAVVGPGETFSLNAATNPRDARHGFVEAGIIEDGHPARGRCRTSSRVPHMSGGWRGPTPSDSGDTSRPGRPRRET